MGAHLGDLLLAGHVSLELDRYPSAGPKYLRSVCDFARHDLAVLALFGMGWGLGAVLFGLGMDRLGMALGYPIIMGLIAGLGALIPLLVFSRQIPHAAEALVCSERLW